MVPNCCGANAGGACTAGWQPLRHFGPALLLFGLTFQSFRATCVSTWTVSCPTAAFRAVVTHFPSILAIVGPMYGHFSPLPGAFGTSSLQFGPTGAHFGQKRENTGPKGSLCIASVYPKWPYLGCLWEGIATETGSWEGDMPKEDPSDPSSAYLSF